MLKKSFALILFLAASGMLAAQVYDPVTWDFSSEKIGDNKYDLIFTATIEKGFHIYALDIPKGGPIPTSFSFDSLPDYALDGKTREITKPDEIFDEAFGFKIKTLSNKAEFRQEITGNKPAFSVKGAVNFMSCNNETCSPPKDVDFTINIGSKETATSAVTTIQTQEKENNPVHSGLLKFFLLSILAGFAGVLTPCVFPMIPMTVAFFSRGSENRAKAIIRAVIFGVSIMFIYLLLGIIVSLTSAGAGFANALATHWIPNLIFFILFVLFAASFFGAFEIVLPNRWVSGADSRADRGGLLATFFMGLTTVIVSFSCTGPIVGALLVEAATGDVLRPVTGMFGFGLAFALPFTLFALFPSVMSRLPKSGGWLNSVKIVLGFLMLAFSMKFLMTIDSVYSLRFLSRDIYLAIWIVLFSLLGFYLLGKIKFHLDSDVPYIGTFRFFLIIAVFTFVVYLITGLFGAPLKGLSALLPAQETSAFSAARTKSFQQQPVKFEPAQSGIGTDCTTPRFSDLFEMPLGLSGYFEYNQGLRCAKAQGKPVLLDFKGHACANCKLMEAKVWSDEEVLKRLSENFVIVSLYADDRTTLPESEWITSAIDGKVKKTIGKINEDLEIAKFRTNALPLYVIIDNEGNPLNKPMPTNLNVAQYKKWLDEGLDLYRKLK